MSNNKGNGGFAGKGYYIALILCAAAIGITSYVYQRNTNSAQPEQAAVEETQEDVLVDVQTPEDVPVIATQPQAPTAGQPAQQPQGTQPPAAAPQQKKPLKPASPVSGETIFGYSMEALSYNQTTRDWRVHNGVDLAAEPGDQVMAAADGEVYSVFEDDTLGHTVMIRHDDGYTTCYASLSQDIPVKAGDRVTQGQLIGYAGDSAIVESALGSHVHFSVTHYDAPMDPAEFLALGQ